VVCWPYSASEVGHRFPAVTRLAQPLLDLGHSVLAVDQSPEMLAHVTGVETVRADIEGLDLRRRFDAVNLASHLVNVPDDRRLRTARLDACRRHVTDGGSVFIERYPPDRRTWLEAIPT